MKTQQNTSADHKRKKGNKLKGQKQGKKRKEPKRGNMCKIKGKVLFMKIRNKREEEGENRRVHIYTVTL